jgi:hypothetical protein
MYCEYDNAPLGAGEMVTLQLLVKFVPKSFTTFSPQRYSELQVKIGGVADVIVACCTAAVTVICTGCDVVAGDPVDVAVMFAVPDVTPVTTLFATDATPEALLEHIAALSVDPSLYVTVGVHVVVAPTWMLDVPKMSVTPVTVFDGGGLPLPPQLAIPTRSPEMTRVATESFVTASIVITPPPRPEVFRLRRFVPVTERELSRTAAERVIINLIYCYGQQHCLTLVGHVDAQPADPIRTPTPATSPRA